MRDWSYSDDYDYGYDGGREYIKKYLEINDDQTDELKSVREFLPSSFEEISCFLMPEPERFIRKRGYDGRWSEMDETFKSELFKFVKSLLSPSNLVIKKNFTKEESTSKQFNDYMKFNFGIFKLF